jgi:ParB/RepB/Spo0J family partition protein
MNYQVSQIPISEIYCDEEFNCRGQITALTVIGLANDIKARGLQTPITVEPFNHPKYKYRIVAGHRRFTAYKINKEDTIPAFIQEFDNEVDSKAYNIIENISRENLTFLQEAKSLEYFFGNGYTKSMIAKKLNRSEGWVEVRRQLLDLPVLVQEEAGKGVINQNHIKGLYLLRNNPEKLFEALRKLKEQLARGEKAQIKKDESLQDMLKAKRPNSADINEALEFIFGSITQQINQNNFGAKALAWANGSISKLEFYVALKTECERLGTQFRCPEEIKKAINGNQSN